VSSTRQNPRTLVCSLFCALLVVSAAMAQTILGSVAGTVTDATGAVMVGSSVTLIHDKTGDSRKSTTNDEGRFVFAAIQPGTYTIKVESQGFQTLEQKGVIVTANENLAMGRLSMVPGQVTETVTVTTGADRVETDSTDLTARLTASQIELISTKGRDITSLLRTVPGTSYETDIESGGGGFGTQMPQISGMRGRSTVVTINGLNASEPSGSNLLSMNITQDAVEEVKVLRNNYGAEFGNNGGAMVNVVPKQGGLEYHGSAYYFGRNEWLNANNFFSNRAGLPRALYRHNTWGFTIGGPLYIPKVMPQWFEKRLFFFFSLERPKTLTPQDLRQVTVPTAAERSGDFSNSFTGFAAGAPTRALVTDPTLTGSCTATVTTACFRDPSRATAANPQGLHIIPQNRFDANGRILLNYYPLPNRNSNPAANDFFNYVVQRSVDAPKWGKLFRVDFKPTSKDSIFVHGQAWTADNEGLQTPGWPGGTPPDANVWGISSHYLYKDNGLTISYVRLFTQNIVNEFSMGLRHDSEEFIPSDGEIDRLSRSALGYTAPQLFAANNTLGTIPRATGFSGVAGRPANINWLDRWGEAGKDYILPSVTDNFSWNKGAHSMRFGIFMERMLNREAPGGNWSGTYDFGNATGFTAANGNTGFAYANALIGTFNSYQESTARPFTNLKRLMIQWYAQDQWKINRQLTLNYGLRMGFASQWYQRDLRASNFVPGAWSASTAPALYQPFCTVATRPCPAASQRALNPITGQQIPLTGTNVGLVGAVVPGSGNLTNGIVLQTGANVPNGFKEVDPIVWEPRLGIAWDLGGRGKTVFRLMGGVYHAPRTGGGTTGGNLVNNPPFLSNLTINFGTIANLSNLIGTSLVRPSALNAVEDHSHTPVTYNYQLGVQQDIGFKTIVEVSYVGSQSRYLGERRNINQVPDGSRFLPQYQNPFTAVGAVANDFMRPFRGYGDINRVTYSGRSNYNALQVQATRRYASGFVFGLAYTWSRTLDYANDDSSDVNFGRPYRLFNYGPADFDQSHIFAVNYIWEIPKVERWRNWFTEYVVNGWTVSGMTNLVSGRPKSVTATYSGTPSATNGVITDFTGGQINGRPNIICNPQRSDGGPVGVATNGTPIFVDQTCLAPPSRIGDIGNMRRNFLRLPGVINFDLAVFKNFKLTERFNLQFRWETYNLFNHTNFSDIDGNITFAVVDANRDGNIAPGDYTITSSTFGQPTAARFPRVMQGSLRISF